MSPPRTRPPAGESPDAAEGATTEGGGLRASSTENKVRWRPPPRGAAHAATSHVQARMQYHGTLQGAPVVPAGGRCTCRVLCPVSLVPVLCPVQSVVVHGAHLHLPALRAWAGVTHALCVVPLVLPQPVHPGAVHYGLCSVLPVPTSQPALPALCTLPSPTTTCRGVGVWHDAMV